MNGFPAEKIRNMGFMAHIDAGKTTTTERILFYSGVTYKIGEVDEGTAVTDWMDQEKERGISITSAATTCYWRDHRINIIDTPGHVDFTAEVERSLRVLDGAVIILCGVAGVQPQTEKVWYQASKYNIPRIAYINKLDRIGSDFREVLAQIEKKFAMKTLLLHLPLGIEDNFTGVIDLLSRRAYHYNGELLGSDYSIIDVPAEYAEDVEICREQLIEKLADLDLEVMERFLEKKEIPVETLKKAVRKATIAISAVPVLLGSSFKNKAVQNLLDGIIDYLPAPADRESIHGKHPKSGEVVVRKLTEVEPMSALVFKIMSDPYVGQLIYFRVYSGCIKVGQTVYNSCKQSRLRIAKLLKMHANKREEVQAVYAGDIAATVGLKRVSTGDTFCDERHPLVLESIQFPDPVISATIEPKLTSDHTKLEEVLDKLLMEDPTLKSYLDKNTGQKIISGMGELHLEVIQERMKREFGIKTKMGKPRVAYHETICQHSVGEGKYNKQAGGKSQFGHVVLELKPYKGCEKYKFSVKLNKGVIPAEFYSAIEAGVHEAMDIGFLAGFSVIQVESTLIGGSFHQEDSNESAFKMAATMAFKEAFRKGNPTLLEPIMRIEIAIQDEYLGAVMDDFNARAGKVLGMDLKNNLHIVSGQVPLASMFGYATMLRTLTQGRATHSMEFDHFKEMTEQKKNDVLRTELGIFAINF